MLHYTGWVPHGFSHGEREFRAEFVFPTSEEMGHPQVETRIGITTAA